MIRRHRTAAKDIRDGSIVERSGRGTHFEVHIPSLPWMETHIDFETRSGQTISIVASIEAWPGRRLKGVTISSPARTVELPPEVVERGDLVNLQTLIPEAFR